MILLYHPRSTRPRNRRFPLSVLALAAVLESREEYTIVDGNVERDPTGVLLAHCRRETVELLAVSVMPGPQMVAAMESCRLVRQLFPKVPIVWGGYFASIYTSATLNAPYVDYAVRGQGEDTLLELLEVLRERRAVETVHGLSYKDSSGAHVNNPERSMKSPNAYPWYPYGRVPAEKYIRPSFFGKRTAVHHASMGCPYHCSFCGVISAYGSVEKLEAPSRTEAILSALKRLHAIDSVQFYDNNFFLQEAHSRELMDRLKPLGLRWWCEARIDVVLRYSASTLQSIRDAGCRMIFFGAESGSNWALQEMRKQLTTEQTLALAKRIRQYDIIPEFSFVIGNPRDPSRDTRECFEFVRALKRINPDSEIILYPYIPVPQREQMYGAVDGQIEFPSTPEEWATPRWQNFAVRKSPTAPWFSRTNQRRVDNFRLVVSSRWPTVQDLQLTSWGRRSLQALSSWRYRLGFYAFPLELQVAQRLTQLRKPEAESL